MRSGSRMAWAAKETSRGSSVAAIPTRDLNHSRCASRRLTRAMGVPQMVAAMRVRASKSASGGVSRMAAPLERLRRSRSPSGRRAALIAR